MLIRTYHPSGTNGSIYLSEVLLCHSIELPWLNNERQRSCIPEGRYELQKRWRPKIGDHYLLVNVPGRDCILIHPANYALKELKGCIAPVTHLTGEGKGSFSRLALKLLQHHVDEVIDSEKVYITICSMANERIVQELGNSVSK
jgi:hypothetical protein